MNKISIVVPVYNVENYIDRCIESIINQTYKNIEIILVDDGSKDNSGKICDKYANRDKRIKVVHKLNGGLSSARNAGLDVCSGEYVGFVDGDDWIEKNMYEILISMIKKGKSEIAICGHREVIQNEKVRPAIQMKNIFLDKNELWEEVFGDLNVASWNKLYKKEIIGNLRFPLNIIHGEDLIFNLQYLVKCKSGVLNKTKCYNYLKRRNSITSSKFSKNKIYEVMVKDKALEIVKRENESQIKNAQKYCFRARMNIIRSITYEEVENEYGMYMTEYKNYIKNNYKLVKKNLKLKEIIEYYIFLYNYKLYKKILKIYKRSK